MQEATFEGWLRAYKQAWEARDPQAATDLFTADATYHETPFDDPSRASEGILEYWSEATRSQEDVTFTYKILAVNGEHGISHWTSNFTRLPSGSHVTLDGIFLVELNDEGRCTEFREWWHKKETA